MIERILFATDLGAYTSHGLIHVESLAQTFNASIDIVHAVKPIDELAVAVIKSHCSEAVKNEVLAASHIKGLLDTVRNEIFEVLASDEYGDLDLVSRVNNIVVEPGPAAAVILSQAEMLDSDLIVIGSHGVDALDGCSLGSVAGKVLQLATIPVYLVPMVNTISQIRVRPSFPLLR